MRTLWRKMVAQLLAVSGAGVRRIVPRSIHNRQIVLPSTLLATDTVSLRMYSVECNEILRGSAVRGRWAPARTLKDEAAG
jgi:hypothetical protein